MTSIQLYFLLLICNKDTNIIQINVDFNQYFYPYSLYSDLIYW